MQLRCYQYIQYSYVKLCSKRNAIVNCRIKDLDYTTKRNFSKSYQRLEKSLLITTPIFYVNGSPHIGHVYSAVLADALSRFHKLNNEDQVVHFTTGTDEHGLKVQEAAEATGTTDYRSFCDNVSQRFSNVFKQANIEYSRFIRTSEPAHAKAVEELWRRVKNNGHIYLGKHEAWYCKSEESFLTDLQVEDYTMTTGVVVKRSKESKGSVERIAEENYKFRLSDFQEPLRQWLKENPGTIIPQSREVEVHQMLDGGLRDLSISRLREKIQWALPVPDDPLHCIYVWFDALTNYLTSSGFPTIPDEGRGISLPASIHIIGKDILKFHAIYYPAFLMAAGLPLPKKIITHAHWTMDGFKMSKSLGNVVDPEILFQKYDADSIRYFLLRESALGDDGDFSEEQLVLRVNSELADSLGNLVTRATGKRILPENKIPPTPLNQVLQPLDHDLIRKSQSIAERVCKYYAEPDFKSGLTDIVLYLHEVNRYFSTNQPWVLAKQLKSSCDETDKIAAKERLDTVLYLSLEAARIAAILLQPVAPKSCELLLNRLSVDQKHRTFNYAKFFVTDRSDIPLHTSDTFVPFIKY